MNKLNVMVLMFGFVLFLPMVNASNGVIEINQTCAANGGCFNGDEQDFPITIDGSAGYSYRLTSDLTVPDVDTTAIYISVANVSIDLNGFAVIRSGCEVSCNRDFGSGFGVRTVDSSLYGVTVKNGSVVGMGQQGIQLLGAQSQVTNVQVRSNFITGISVGNASIVSGSTSYDNLIGILGGFGSLVKNNTSYLNSGDGIIVKGASTVISNTVYVNGGNGILAEKNCSIYKNTITTSAQDGIVAGKGSSVQQNTVGDSDRYGLNFDDENTMEVEADVAYSQNVMSGNGGEEVLGGLNMGGNFCDGVICP